MAATEIRSSNKATPGPPRGNMENSRCTILRIMAFANALYPNWSYAAVTLLGDSDVSSDRYYLRTQVAGQCELICGRGQVC